MIPYITNELGVYPGWTLPVINIVFLIFDGILKFVIVNISILLPIFNLKKIPPKELPIDRRLRILECVS